MSVFWAAVATVIWVAWPLPAVGDLRMEEPADALPLSKTPGTRFVLLGTVWPLPPASAEPSAWLISREVVENTDGPDDIEDLQRPPFRLQVGETVIDFPTVRYRIDNPPSREEIPKAHFFAPKKTIEGFRVGDPARVIGEIDASGRPQARTLVAGPERLQDPSAPPGTYTATERVYLQWMKGLLVGGLYLWAVGRLWRINRTRTP